MTRSNTARSLFGTDGIRGRANEEPMTPETALAVAKAAGALFTRGRHRHLAVIGKDTRLSGYLIEPALTAGFISVGMDVVLLGPLPTPAVGVLTRSLRADLGVMISASHNPFEDNGIKLFGPDGYKLSDAVEAEIESRIGDARAGKCAAQVPSERLGRARRLDDERGRYTEFVKQTFPRDLSLAGLKVVVDCANGAAYRVAPTVLYELGAEVVPLGVTPDGLNINKGCGATATEAMQAAVVAQGADLGIALDGDADRLIVADEKGRVIDGDQLMALIGSTLAERGELKGGAVVATVMSNLGLEKFLGGKGIDLKRTKVGDRYVLEAMRESGCNVGGEQSGHLILTDHATTGDGIVAGLQVLAALVSGDKPASELLDLFDAYPQQLKNVRYGETDPLEHPRVQGAIAAAEAKLADTGRLLIRKSGTEPLIRVMAEGLDDSLVGKVVDEIVEVIEDVL